MRVLIIGCGDIGRRVAKLHLGRGDDVTGLVRREDVARKIEEDGLKPLQGDLDHPDSLPKFQNADIIYIFTPPPNNGIHDPHSKNLLENLTDTQPTHIVYISSTAVYGDQQGRLVTEETPPTPTSDRGRRRLAAENAVMKFAAKYSWPVTVLRVAAIYGPGRLPLKTLEKELPVLEAAASGPGNRIHANDLAMLCVTAARSPNGQRIYNVADNNPLPQADYLDQLADLLELPRPKRMNWQQAEQTLSKKQLEFLTERRQVDATRILRELKINLKYVDLTEGLRASLAEEQQ